MIVRMQTGFCNCAKQLFDSAIARRFMRHQKGASAVEVAIVAAPFLVWSEVEFFYTPTVGYVLTGTLKLTDQIYMRPRLSDSVTRTAS